MRLHRLAPLGLLLLLFTASCSEGGLTTGLGHPGDALHAISDGAHDGTEGFYFLPPMVKKPAYSGAFAATLSPVVEICESPACDAIHASFSMTEGTGSELVRMDEAAEHYKVNWHTDRTGTEVGRTYRVQVSVAGAVLGFADIEMAGNGRDARNTTTDEVIGLVDGRTLPITFRIEEGSAWVVGPDGGIFELLYKAVMVEIPQGALDENISLSVKSVNDEMSDPDLVPELVFEFLPSPYSFNQPVIVTIAFDPNRLPDGMAAAELRLLALVDDEWVQLPGSAVDLASSTVRGPLNSFSRKAVGRGKVHAVAVSPAGASVEIGETQQFEVTVTNVDGDEMDRNVQWSSSDEAVATVDNMGLATGADFGETTVEAKVGNISGSAVLMVEAEGPAVAEIIPETIAGARHHTCGLTSTGEAYCWGRNNYGQLGDGTTENSLSPVPVAGSLTFKTITAGMDLTCALTVDGEAYCWGFGFLGDGEGQRSDPQPVAVAGDHTFRTISANTNVCGVTTTNEARCWGSNQKYQAGVGSTDESFGGSRLPALVVGGHEFSAVFTRYLGACGITTDGNTLCWGWNNIGQVGDGTAIDRSSPTLVSGGHTFKLIRGGANFTCGLTPTGAAYCWGSNYAGALGNESVDFYSLAPVEVSGGFAFETLGASLYVACGVTAAGTAYCWGHNEHGEVGDDTRTRRNTPTAVFGDLVFTSVIGASWHTCGLTTSGSAYCWGQNSYGKLGNGNTTNSNRPVEVSGYTFEY
jgi:alpha-tubulin suppressor-like RCC1 family protein